MSDKIMWAVSSGSYSDYRVHCLCASEADAEALVARMKASGDSYGSHADAFVESLPVIAADVQRIETLSLQVNIWDDGTETGRRQDVRVQWPFDVLFEGEDKPVSWRWVRAPIHRGKGGRLEVRGTDHERVRKVYGDQRAAFHADDALRARGEVRHGA